ncbi:MAG: DUF554 domain-containing protein [Lachnospiraceae bacterium]|nr:DUF554 domain-containing protein [Lachnospiraceae bacterium]
MPGLGTIINAVAIIIGGLLGHFFGKILNERVQDSLIKASGVSVLFLGIAGALEGMLRVEDGHVLSGKAVFIVVSLSLGALVGELLNIEGQFERFGEWLKKKTGNSKDNNFVSGFLTASFTVCIGAMAIIGSIEDGINHNYSILFTKALLDLIIIMVMASSLGKGPIFSFIPVAIFQGFVTILARIIEPLLNANAISMLSMVGSILIFCVGINLVWDKKIRVASLLPSVLFAVIFSYFM